MGGQVKGRADYLLLGDYNAACSMCGRKRKASQLVRNWQGLYRCPEHNEPRQPQDFVRNVKDVMTVPWAQPEQDIYVTNTATFPLGISPTNVTCLLGSGTTLLSETGQVFETESGIQFITEFSYVSPIVTLTVPPWINVTQVVWDWLSGGTDIGIDQPTYLTAQFESLVPGSSGVAQVIVTSDLGTTASALVDVVVSGGSLGGDTSINLLLGLTL